MARVTRTVIHLLMLEEVGELLITLFLLLHLVGANLLRLPLRQLQHGANPPRLLLQFLQVGVLLKVHHLNPFNLHSLLPLLAGVLLKLHRLKHFNQLNVPPRLDGDQLQLLLSPFLKPLRLNLSLPEAGATHLVPMLGDLRTLATLATLDGVLHLAAAGKKPSSFLCDSLLICFLSLSFFANMTGLRGNLSKLSQLSSTKILAFKCICGFSGVEGRQVFALHSATDGISQRLWTWTSRTGCGVVELGIIMR
jgi:hypothetical protein